MKQIDYFRAVELVEKGANVYHVDAPEGVCYVISNEFPHVDNAYIIAQIPNKFAKNPRLYNYRDYYRGCFWWAA